jgi:hypothetical protein
MTLPYSLGLLVAAQQVCDRQDECRVTLDYFRRGGYQFVLALLKPRDCFEATNTMRQIKKRATRFSRVHETRAAGRMLFRDYVLRGPYVPAMKSGSLANGRQGGVSCED